MAKIIALVLLLSAFAQLSGQIETLEIPETVIPDSLIAPKEEPDSAAFNVSELKKEIEQYIETSISSENDLLSSFFYNREDHHLYSAFDPTVIMNKNGFSLLPFQLVNYHYLQRCLPFYHIELKNMFCDIEPMKYSSAPALAKAYMGIGANDSYFSSTSLQKGNLFNLKNLSLGIFYNTEKGQVTADEEKIKHLDLFLNYENRWGDLELFYTEINEEIPTSKLIETNTSVIVQADKKEIGFLLRNNMFSAGYKYEKWEEADSLRKADRLLLIKDFAWRKHKFDLKAEFVKFDSRYDSTMFILSAKNSLYIGQFVFRNRLQYFNEKTYNNYTGFGHRVLKNNFLNLQYHQDAGRKLSEKWGVGLELDYKNLETELLIGKKIYKNTEYDFLEMKNRTMLKFSALGILLQNRILYNRTDSALNFLPKLIIDQNLIFNYDLKHNNALKLGFSFLRHLSYIDQAEIDSSWILNSFAAIQITKRFEIKLSVPNLNNSSYLFDENINGMHLNYSFRWFFVN